MFLKDLTRFTLLITLPPLSERLFLEDASCDPVMYLHSRTRMLWDPLIWLWCEKWTLCCHILAGLWAPRATPQLYPPFGGHHSHKIHGAFTYPWRASGPKIFSKCINPLWTYTAHIMDIYCAYNGHIMDTCYTIQLASGGSYVNSRAQRRDFLYKQSTASHQRALSTSTPLAAMWSSKAYISFGRGA